MILIWINKIDDYSWKNYYSQLHLVIVNLEEDHSLLVGISFFYIILNN